MDAKVEEIMAKVKLLEAQVEKTKAETVNHNVDAQYSGIQTAATIAQQPQTAALADQLLRSAGYEDKDAPPIFPGQGAGTDFPFDGGAVNAAAGATPDGLLDLPPNTNPTTPVPPPQTGSPTVGANAGIETQRIEGV